MSDAEIDQRGIETLIGRWHGVAGGAERSNLPVFIAELSDALGLPRDFAPSERGKLGAYQYEAPVPHGSFRSLKAKGSIDLYRRGRFILEAKQSFIPESAAGQPELYDVAPGPAGPRYDRLMRDARAQAENYARNLPGGEPSVPFLIVCDIGRGFELYFDFAGNGRGYDAFPDARSHRIGLDQLRDPVLAGRLRAVWSDPRSIDPRLHAAEVTRDIAERLATVSRWLEETQKSKVAGLGTAEKSQAVEETALFLMRLLFCMFAEEEGIELLPRDSFKAFLESVVENDADLERGLSDLWGNMNRMSGDRWSWAVREQVRFFNGGLFEHQTTYRLGRREREELVKAAARDWRTVEPAIFGTLLERALNPAERAKLGAHYTPRAYVERLVDATVIEVLRGEWESVQGEISVDSASAFHDRLAATRVLDPACGTGNFLYVAMEAMARLEAEVIGTIRALGGVAGPRIGPGQFFGLEKNVRAAKIAELVIWIGWLRLRMADDPRSIRDPVLGRGASINGGARGGYDAILAADASGEPDLANPAPAAWPEVEFIVGNPPFIGGKDIRAELGGDYAEALTRANPRVPASADLVMHWWDRAADALTREGAVLRRFGFVTTNSITQVFSRRVIAGWLDPSPRSPLASRPLPQRERGYLSLILAVPDHPWVKAPPAGERGPRRKRAKERLQSLDPDLGFFDPEDEAAGKSGPAAVRIAMTVAQAGAHAGRLVEVTAEARLDSDTPLIETAETVGRINADLSIGPDVTTARPLRANAGLSSPGVKLHGAGFIVTPEKAEALGLGRVAGLERHIRHYRNGRDLLGRSRGMMVIDLYGLTHDEVLAKFGKVYEHLVGTVLNSVDPKTRKPNGRAVNNRASYKTLWWVFGEPRGDLRPALIDLPRYIATVETAKHRVFQFLDASILPDNKLVAIGTDNAFHLGVLSSNIHFAWYYRRAGMIGVYHEKAVYVKTACFDPFPFPDATPEQRAGIAKLAEALDATRAQALAGTPGLTMTEIYNLRARIEAGEVLAGEDAARADAARARTVSHLHREIDARVAEAYGWEADIAPAEIVARLVTLNAARAAQEAAREVRWLRPEFQERR